GVPGTVAGLLAALDSYGTMTRDDVLSNPIELAERGFHIGDALAASLLEYHSELTFFPSTSRVFTNNGEPYRAGELFKQPALARTLQAIRANGMKGFYGGEVADLIVAEMKRSGGLITEDDLLLYTTVERRPVAGTYRGFEIISAPPPSAGGMVLIEMLNLLEPFDLRRTRAGSYQTLHLLVAAAQRAYADRAKFPADPDFVNVPIETLISKRHALDRQPPIDPRFATSSARISYGTIDVDHDETTHYCVADSFGNVVSATVTLNSLYGCKLTVDGAGFLLNNEMGDFVIKPGESNQFGLVGGEANTIAPHKRMLSSMTPTIVLTEGEPYLLLGGRGGGRITTAVVQVIMNVVDFGMNIQDAVGASRIHHQWMPDTVLYEPGGLPGTVIEGLRDMGYNLQETSTSNARVQAILIDRLTRSMYGGSDPRERGIALGF
ncbi:MAG: gamma-glutamyltransferase, partial [Ignavibacteriae bacterium]|nr:gamma-glutamyltransferase [Ignavibacteriota bacterium]